MAYIYSTLQREQRFFDLSFDTDPRLRLYIYRMIEGQIVRPNLYAGSSIDNLEAYIQSEFGGGKYYVIFRRGERMEFSGDLSIAWAHNDPRNARNVLRSA